MKKSALITGAARRIGREIALKLAKNGYDIAIHYNKSETEAESLKNDLKKLKVKSNIYQCNLNNEKEVSALIKNVYSDFNNLSLLVNNASIFVRSSILNTKNQLLNKTFNINFKAPYILTREFANICKKGNIINIIDTKITKNGYFYSAYSLSKQALCHLTKQSANELAPDIRVNGICPGLIFPQEGEDLQKMANKIPLKKAGNINSITAALLFLLKNEYITGQLIYVDGGQHL